jgi:hypothetical protein
MPKGSAMNSTKIVQDLHDAGICAGVVWPVPASLGVSLGNQSIAMAVLPAFTAALEWLRVEGVSCYPHSTFAAKYRAEKPRRDWTGGAEGLRPSSPVWEWLDGE